MRCTGEWPAYGGSDGSTSVTSASRARPQIYGDGEGTTNTIERLFGS
jgi:hypothetical protein